MEKSTYIAIFYSRLLFYNSYILPRIDYCLPIWGRSAKQGLDKQGLDRIWRLQKRAIRIVCNISYDTSTHDLFKQLGWMNIYKRYFYQVCLNVFNILSTDCSPISSLVNLHSDSRFYNLRSNSSHKTLDVPFPRKELFKQSFLYSAPITWNILPIEIRTSTSLNIFKHLCKHFVLLNNVCNY